MLRKFLRQLIQNIDQDIHERRVEKILGYFADLKIIVYLLTVSIMIGVAGFMIIEDLNFIDAFYMTIITVSTVGYGEVIPLSDGGKLFASFLIITNIGVFAYAVSSIAGFIVEGEYRKALSDLIQGRKIDKMRNHIIVCGYGRYGANVIEHLLTGDEEVVLIESEKDKVMELRNENEIHVLEGDATDEHILKEAGILTAKALITTLPVDADNVYVILTARQLNPSMKIVSRARAASSQKNMHRAGADHVLLPESIGGFYLSAMVTKPDIINFLAELSNTDAQSFRIAEVVFTNLSQDIEGKPLSTLRIEEKSGVKIIGLKTKGQLTINPSGDERVVNDSALLVLGDNTQINKFKEMTGRYQFIQ